MLVAETEKYYKRKGRGHWASVVRQSRDKAYVNRIVIRHTARYKSKQDFALSIVICL